MVQAHQDQAEAVVLSMKLSLFCNRFRPELAVLDSKNMEKTLRLKRNWAKPQDEQHMMKRLHDIVSGGPDGPFEKDDGYKWQLDASNNWWAELRHGASDPPGEKHILVLCARYAQEITVLDVLRVVSDLVDFDR